MPVGFTFPFARSSGSVGYFNTTDSELDATKENLKALLLTNWGERPMRYHFGCNLREFLFENRTGEEQRISIADRITSQVGKYMPFVIVEELNILTTEDDSSVPEYVMRIRLRFRLTNKPELTTTLDVDARLG